MARRREFIGNDVLYLEVDDADTFLTIFI